MQIINPNIVMFDVDGTIVEFLLLGPAPSLDETILDIPTPSGKTLAVTVKTHIVQKIRQHHAQGHYVIVWSQGGEQWANNVLRALDLIDCVDIVMTKPKWYYDDLPADEWMKRTIP